MSAEAVGRTWDHMPAEWPATTKLVALAMADVVNDMHGWRYWASVPALARKCGIGVRSARDAIRTLEADGWITQTEARPGEAAVYRWTFDPGKICRGHPNGGPAESAGGPADPAGVSPIAVETQRNASDDGPSDQTTLTLIAGSGGSGSTPKVNGKAPTSRVSAAPNTSSPRGRTGEGHRLPNLWPLTDELRAIAAGVDDRINVERQHADFCDYWWAKAGKDARKTDWLATWRKWVRKSADDLPPRARTDPAAPERSAEEIDAAVAAMAARAAR